MKKNILAFLFIISLFAASCIDDKGSYDYTELADIKIEGMERFEGKRIVRVPISTAICSADILLEKIEERLGCCVEKKI